MLEMKILHKFCIDSCSVTVKTTRRIKEAAGHSIHRTQLAVALGDVRAKAQLF